MSQLCVLKTDFTLHQDSSVATALCVFKSLLDKSFGSYFVLVVLSPITPPQTAEGEQQICHSNSHLFESPLEAWYNSGSVIRQGKTPHKKKTKCKIVLSKQCNCSQGKTGYSLSQCTSTNKGCDQYYKYNKIHAHQPLY